MAGRKRGLCTATRKDGEPCQARAVAGGTVCRYHGGAASQVAAAAERRAGRADAAAITDRLGVITNAEDPFEAAMATLRHLRHLEHDLARDVLALTASGGLRYEHARAGEQIRGEWTVYQRVAKDVAELSLAIIRAGVEERLAEVSEMTAAAMVAFITRALARFGVDFSDPAAHAIVMTVFDEVIRHDGELAPLAIEDGSRWPAVTPVCEMDMHQNCRAYMPVDGLDRPPAWPARCPCSCHDPAAGTVYEWQLPG
jgi:hypothetical protein